MDNYDYGYVVESKITALGLNDIVNEIFNWVKKKDKKKYVCVCNTHSIVTAKNNEEFNKVLSNADICTADGMPLVWALRNNGFINQERVDGPNLMLKLCEEASRNKCKIYLYGGTKNTLKRLNELFNKEYPSLEIVGSFSPPFRNLSNEEKIEIQNEINKSKADIVFVSLGCPKQEIWMYENVKAIDSILIGVGAAFNFILGDIKRAPLIFQRLGLEWFFRLISEPKRLWKRYLYNNSQYIYSYIRTYKKNKQLSRLRRKNNNR